MISALSRRNDFLLLRSSGTTRRSGPLRARVVTSQSQPVDAVKLGFTISRKFGSAVSRNRMRRRLRHCVHEVARSSEIDTSHVLLGANPSALQSPHPELMRHCRVLLGAESTPAGTAP